MPTPAPADAPDLIVDCDVHPRASERHPLSPFIAPEHRELFAQKMNGAPTMGYLNPFGVDRRDAEVFDPHDVGRDHLDRYGLTYAVLQSPGLSVSLSSSIDAGNAAAAAWNRWQEPWLDADGRYLGSISVNTEDAAFSVAEIDKWADHPQVVQVNVGGESGDLYGHRRYWPLWAACEAGGVALTLHPGTEGCVTPSTPVGRPSTYFEWHTGLPITFQAHLISLIAEGVFEKFPKLRVVLCEGGVFWLVHTLLRMDKNFKALRATTPWLKMLPSEYAHRQVRFTTQPIEEPATSAQFLQLLDLVRAEKTLMFATDAPALGLRRPGPRAAAEHRPGAEGPHPVRQRRRDLQPARPGGEDGGAGGGPRGARGGRGPIVRGDADGGGGVSRLDQLPPESPESPESPKGRGGVQGAADPSIDAGVHNSFGSERGPLSPVESAFAVADAMVPPKSRRGNTIVVCPLSDLPPGHRRIVDDGKQGIGVFNVAGTLHAIKNVCPHIGAPLAMGSLHNTHRPSDVGEFVQGLDGRVLRCPWHGWEFDLATGQGLHDLKCRVAVYEVGVDEAGNVVVKL